MAKVFKNPEDDTENGKDSRNVTYMCQQFRS